MINVNFPNDLIYSKKKKKYIVLLYSSHFFTLRSKFFFSLLLGGAECIQPQRLLTPVVGVTSERKKSLRHLIRLRVSNNYYRSDRSDLRAEIDRATRWFAIALELRRSHWTNSIYSVNWNPRCSVLSILTLSVHLNSGLRGYLIRRPPPPPHLMMTFFYARKKEAISVSSTPYWKRALQVRILKTIWSLFRW